MFKKLSDTLKAKFGGRDELSRQLEIVKIFDIYKEVVKKNSPKPAGLPIKLRNKVLTVQTTSPSQANELRFEELRALQAINQKIGREVVRRIIYRY